ncbi:hypothetical protein ITJ86_05125 [Winogradskyella sp. F6397]|uniref:Tetratricopeptide repeat protein n=1 Tax=Winogradskyella marina TaxID=2785530 RepID=A0ABS0EGE2_9FLAO|nr:hypothetical protein [Winogradskyella marina]MBF8149266.1 hypothetical protein [Winogradskyella marina]
MNNGIEIVKELLLPHIELEVSPFIENIDWATITSSFICYEDDPKPLYTEIYKLELSEPENVITQLPTLYKSFIDEMAEQFVLGIENETITTLLKKQNALFTERVTFFKILESAITKQERRRIIKELPSLSDRINFSLSDIEMKAAIKKKARTDLKDKFSEWDNDLIAKKEEWIFAKKVPDYNQTNEGQNSDSSTEKKTQGKVISLSWIKYAVAAILLLGFFIWQPTQKTNNELFALYENNLTSLTEDNFSLLEFEEFYYYDQRGDENILENYSLEESNKAFYGLNAFKDENYDKAKEILTELKPKAHNNQILFFLSLSQLNTNDLDNSIINLEYLLNQTNFSYSDDVKFHLSMAYLKKGDRNKSKLLLKQLIANNSKFKDESQLILKEMRWF